MGFLSRLFGRKPATKAVQLNMLGGSPTLWTNPEQVPAHLNGVVMAASKFVSRAFPEAPLVVEQANGDTWEAVRQHKLAKLVGKPNPWYGGNLLWAGTTLSLLTEGNAYWWKARSASGQVRELWYMPHTQVEPVSLSTTQEFIDYYQYTTGGQTFRLSPDDVVHFRDGINPDKPMLGLSPLSAGVRELRADQALAQYTHAILRNLGVVGVMITPKGDQVSIEPEQAEYIKAKFKSLATGENRGEPLVLDAPLDVQSPGWSPKDIDAASMAQPLEARLCAVLGVHPTVLGLSVGLEHSTFSNMKEARESAWESLIIPMQSLCASELDAQLLPDLGDENRERCKFDLSGVRALAEDENAKAERLANVYKAGGIKRSEFRTALGYDSAPEDEVYYTDLEFSGGKALSQAEVVKQLRDRAAQRQSAYNALQEQ